MTNMGILSMLADNDFMAQLEQKQRVVRRGSEQMGVSLEEAEREMCKESGLKALSGGYNDFRDIEEQARQGNRINARAVTAAYNASADYRNDFNSEWILDKERLVAHHDEGG